MDRAREVDETHAADETFARHGPERAGRTGEAGTAPGLFDRLLLPIASEEDVDATCTAFHPYVDANDTRLTVVHVIEKTPGYPDKAPLGARREQARRVFRLVHQRFADVARLPSTDVRYGSNVVEEILVAADGVDATAIGFVPRARRRLTRMLAGDVAYRLVTTSRRPVVVLPRPDADQG